MNDDILETSAILKNDNQKIPVVAKYASRYSLWIKFQRNCDFAFNENCTLIIPVNGDSLEISHCRLIADPSGNGTNGRLVFLNDVYDIKSLLSSNKIIKLQSLFKTLPNIIARKRYIKYTFKDFTTNLTYDLSVYKNFFDRLDAQYRNEPDAIRKAIQEAIINTEGQKFWQFLNSSLYELESLVRNFDIEDHQTHGFYFRKQIWNFLLCSPLMARTNLKPRGYSGDSETMRMIYLNDYCSDSTFNTLLNRHGVEHTAAQSVRNRIELISHLLNAFHKKMRNNSHSQIKVLSIGSGPAYEIKKIIQSKKDCTKYHFSLLDHDPKALAEANTMVTTTEKRLKSKIDAEFINGSVRTVLFSKTLKENWGQFDFIYSLGLFDYLSNPVAKASISNFYKILEPGGEMVIGNFHTSNPSKYYMEYWCDWVLNLRSEKEMLELSDDITPSSRTIIFEDTGSQMFLHIKN